MPQVKASVHFAVKEYNEALTDHRRCLNLTKILHEPEELVYGEAYLNLCMYSVMVDDIQVRDSSLMRVSLMSSTSGGSGRTDRNLPLAVSGIYRGATAGRLCCRTCAEGIVYLAAVDRAGGDSPYPPARA